MRLSSFGLLFVLLAGPVLADDMEDSFQKLKEAETAKDAALVKKLAAETHALAAKAIAEPAPQNAEEKDAWTKHVAYAKEVDLQTEYAFVAVAAASEPATAVELLEALEAQNPKSKYLDGAYERYIYVLHQAGQDKKIIPTAERGIKSFPANEDLLMVLADASLSSKQIDRALGYARRLVAAYGSHGKPEGLSAADWERKRTTQLGRGHWIVGVLAQEKGLYAEANRSLRAAVPLIKENTGMLGPAYYYLGLANYRLGVQTNNKAQVLEAAKFCEQSSAITWPEARTAWLDAQRIKGEAAKMR